eukprot:gnl/MRDRNA2_/MRDRNA2_88708_c0_seq1.p1 gnl/MRDRNA2_/MRDRNA2_88708_c0~~gnl/MRDRNA2_/MRDRNA2_88708_c0_seq1.p1  ORF type:complete len:361 (+),score=81.20 gnl/MRDRNA2_/MRDRNA2_88708_c0_seq1:115-1197(+)
MRSFKAITLLALLFQVNAELNMALQDADLDDATLGMLANPVRGNARYQGAQNWMATPQFRTNPRSYQATPYQSAPISVPQLQQQQQAIQQRFVMTAAEAAEAEAPAGPTYEGKNIFGEDLAKCSASEDCTYTAESPQICVGLTPRVREGAKDPLGAADARSFELTAPEGQFKWSDSYVGQCIPFFEFGSDSFMKGIRFGNQDLVPKCDAIPSSMFTSDFSMDLWQNCKVEAKVYKYISPSSSKWKGDQTETTDKDPFFIKKPSFGQEQPDKMSAKCERFRQGIEKIASLCSQQGSSSQMETLNKIKATMGPAPALSESTMEVTTSPAMALFCFLVAGGVIFTMSRTRRGASTPGQPPLLG